VISLEKNGTERNGYDPRELSRLLVLLESERVPMGLSGNAAFTEITQIKSFSHQPIIWFNNFNSEASIKAAFKTSGHVTVGEIRVIKIRWSSGNSRCHFAPGVTPITRKSGTRGASRGSFGSNRDPYWVISSISRGIIYQLSETRFIQYTG